MSVSPLSAAGKVSTSTAIRPTSLDAESDAIAWDRFVEQDPRGTLYHRLSWLRLVHDLFGHPVLLWLAERDGEVVGVLPLVRLTSRLFGDFCVSLPYVNYGGALGVSPEVEQRLMRSAVETCGPLGVSHIEFRDAVRRPGDWPVREDKVCMLLALPEDEQTLFEGFRAKLRSQIRRPEKAGARASILGAEGIDDFYRVFSTNMRDLGTPVYSKRFFTEILHRFPEAARLALVHMGTEPAAAGLLVCHGESIEIPWASALRRYNRESVNMLLYWRALCHGIERGCASFDFGRSSRDSGTYRFKQQWGANERPLYWHYGLLGSSEPPQLNPSNPRYRAAIELWKRLPVPVTTLLGPHLVKNLP